MADFREIQSPFVKIKKFRSLFDSQNLNLKSFRQLKPKPKIGYFQNYFQNFRHIPTGIFENVSKVSKITVDFQHFQHIPVDSCLSVRFSVNFRKSFKLQSQENFRTIFDLRKTGIVERSGKSKGRKFLANAEVLRGGFLGKKVKGKGKERGLG